MMDFDGQQLRNWKLANPNMNFQDGSMLLEIWFPDYRTSYGRQEKYPENQLLDVQEAPQDG